MHLIRIQPELSKMGHDEWEGDARTVVLGTIERRRNVNDEVFVEGYGVSACAPEPSIVLFVGDLLSCVEAEDGVLGDGPLGEQTLWCCV